MADKDVDVSQAVMLPSPVTVHGVVIGGVLPIKTSKTKSGIKYFDGTFTDGKKASPLFALVFHGLFST